MKWGFDALRQRRVQGRASAIIECEQSEIDDPALTQEQLLSRYQRASRSTC